MKHYLKLLRVHQYVKNFFVFLPLFFDLKILDIGLLQQTFYAFVSFCFVSSGVYIVNDIRDIEKDRNHPKKKNRPLAAGIIKKQTAVIISIAVAATGFLISWTVSFNLLYITGAYALMNLLYSFVLKDIPPLDIFIIATGFLLRILAGTDYAGVSGVMPSQWIIIMTYLLALFLAVAKRRDDVMLFIEKNRDVRDSVRGYNIEFINSVLSIMAAVIIVSYIMYSLSDDVVRHFNSKYVYLSVIFVILGVFRYLQITFVFHKSGSPTEVLLRDRFLQTTIIGWLGMFIYLAY
ncbi:MAG: UbiA prenyltransferase family protein [bacterium]